MLRRRLLTAAPLLALPLVFANSAQAQVSCVPPGTSATAIDVVAELKALRITAGPYAGGYEIAPNGRLNWYFTNLGLLPLVQRLSAPDLELYIRSYLDLYLRNVSASSTIQDVNFPFGRANPTVFTLVPSDSDDAYASTFLSLAVRYVRASSNWTWWEANKAALKNIAYRNLALTAKASGLAAVFQAPRSQTNSFGYLMDNCEGYRGLRDLAALLRSRSELIDANYYDRLASNVALGLVNQCFNSTAKAFAPSDGNQPTSAVFYPGTTCQIYPQAFGLVELASLFSYGWNTLNALSPGWETGKLDPYPWAILGYVAALRGETTLAVAKTRSVEQLFASNRSLVTINELGFYLRTQSVLAGQVDV